MGLDGEYELTYRALDGQWCKGWFTLSEGGRTITVHRPDGRTKSTQVGGSAGHEESLAKMILSERDHWNRPMPKFEPPILDLPPADPELPDPIHNERDLWNGIDHATERLGLSLEKIVAMFRY